MPTAFRIKSKDIRDSDLWSLITGESDEKMVKHLTDDD